MLFSDLYKHLEQNPEDAEAHWKLGCCLAYRGQWEEAWPELEWRFRGHVPSMNRRQQYNKPNWDGKSENVLIYQDQGYGDLFQWIRYVHKIQVPYTIACGGNAVRLLRLQNFNTVSHGELIRYENIVPVCSLPRYYSSDFASEPYFVAPSGKFRFNSGKKIGIAWTGNSEYYNNRDRSCPPEEFTALSGELVSLMLHKTTLFTDMSMRIVDFADTAEIISHMDAVVSIDTAVAHLAAALGKPVFLILPHKHDWRWMNQETTPWYPTMKIYRQDSPGDWKSIFNQIKGLI
jgi:hypothetical protein